MSALTCQELVELVTEYLDNALPAEKRSAFEQHISGCSSCWNYVEQMRYTVKLVGKLSEKDIPSPYREEMLSAFRTWRDAGK